MAGDDAGKPRQRGGAETGEKEDRSTVLEAGDGGEEQGVGGADAEAEEERGEEDGYGVGGYVRCDEQEGSKGHQEQAAAQDDRLISIGREGPEEAAEKEAGPETGGGFEDGA